MFHPASEQNCSEGDRCKRYCYNRKSSSWSADRRGSVQWCDPSCALKKLHDIIVTPIADLTEGNELTFVPEGPFCLVPYAALQDSNSSYLSDSFRIRVLPSLTTLQLIHDCPADFHMKTGALLVGDPCFKHIIYEGGLLVQLPGARKEVEMIGRILNVPLLTGEMEFSWSAYFKMSWLDMLCSCRRQKKVTQKDTWSASLKERFH